MKMTLDDISRISCVRNIKPIMESPLADSDIFYEPGHVGYVCDVDFANGVAFVDFGDGATACTPDELEPRRND